MLTNFQLKRLKLKLDIVEKPEHRVHKLTDYNGRARAPLIHLAQSLINAHCILVLIKVT